MGSNFHRILIITGEGAAGRELQASLTARGYACSLARDTEDLPGRRDGPPPALVLVASPSGTRIGEITREIKKRKDLPVIALVEKEAIAGFNGYLDTVDDFITRPYDPKELNLRMQRLLRKTGQAESDEVIKCGDLSIDPSRCAITVDGRPVELTFREYELLRFLAANRGRVFTRDALLDRVWGDDYYGGDRTVDVHIRRLRSKIEGPTHSFIETVRNIGYRFRDA